MSKISKKSCESLLNSVDLTLFDGFFDAKTLTSNFTGCLTEFCTKTVGPNIPNSQKKKSKNRESVFAFYPNSEDHTSI